jgi:hypothetical protein
MWQDVPFILGSSTLAPRVKTAQNTQIADMYSCPLPAGLLCMIVSLAVRPPVAPWALLWS